MIDLKKLRPAGERATIDVKALIAPRGARPAAGQTAAFQISNRAAVAPSDELERILALDRRPVPGKIKAAALIELMGDRYGLGPRACECRNIDYKRRCITQLRLTQAWALYEIGLCSGLLGPINVGDGKTILDVLAALAVPDCKVALLLVPAKLVDQLVLEYRMVREHFRVPSLVVHGRDWVARASDGPVLHCISYERLSQKDATTFLDNLRPDLILADECDCLRNPDAVRTGRVLRYFEDHPETRFCGWTGSMTDSGLKDYSHLSALALRYQSPLPIDPDIAQEWAKAIDPGDFPAPMGALVALCNPGEHVRAGFHRRLIETTGVVTSTTQLVDAQLEIVERDAPDMPGVIESALVELREFWTRPDGEELLDALAFFRCARELACGFYYHWIFTHGETEDQIEEWLAARKAWRREIRDVLGNPRPHLDSPHLVARAAARGAEAGVRWGDLYYAPTEESDEPLPHLGAEHWARWQRAKPLVNGGRTPETRAKRLHPYLVEDAAAWASDNRGIVWYAAQEFGAWVSEVSGLPLHGGGADAGEKIATEDGSRSIVASIASHGRGRDGLQYHFCDQLVAHPPASATAWEQLLGRLHRSGQESDVVRAQYYAHTDELAKSIDQALRRALYVQETIGNVQKLNLGILSDGAQ